ncbi:MAG: DEAD/DEAH box helicase [Candidatus Methylopumilus sp.]|jgi:superfamily II DNA or RNA helicase
MTEFIQGSPGVSLARLFKEVDSARLIELLDPEIYSILASTAPDVIAGPTFPGICAKLVDARAILQSKTDRQKLLRLLSSDKASELLIKLKEAPTNNPSTQLTTIDFSKAAVKLIIDFFGLEDEERVAQPLEPEIQPTQIEYGLFLHQRDVAKRTMKVMDVYPHKALLHMPTGSGKTRTSMDIVVRHLADQEPTLIIWLAQSAELLNQAASEFQRAWKNIGNRQLPIYRFWGKYSADLEFARDGILVAGFSKLHALYQRDANMIMRLGDRTSLIVVDEAHQAIAPTYKALIEKLHSKKPENRLLGLSATPGRTWNDVEKDAHLSDFFDNKKVTLEIEGFPDPVSYLEKEGYLAKPVFKLIESHISNEFKAEHSIGNEEFGDYSDDQLELISADSDRNQTILREAESLLKNHLRVILFASSVKHAKLLVAILIARGFDADFITGETPHSVRERIIRKFKQNDSTPRILCNYGVLTTGFDAPLTSAALIARPTRSLVLYSQMVGRVIRGPKQGGNAHAEIVTIVDPSLPGFGSVADAFTNWDDVWGDPINKSPS